jgi:hypothetical protein
MHRRTALLRLSATARHTRRALLAGLAGTAAFAALPTVAREPSAAVPKPERIAVAAKRFSDFEVRDPQRRQFGPLLFRGGLTLSSKFRRFGGLSSLRVHADGSFLSASDHAWWLRGRIVYDGIAPAGVADAEMAPMLGPDGRTLASRHWYDTESLAEDGGTLYVGIERVHEIVRFDYGASGLQAWGLPIAVPPAIKALPANKGLEALAVVPKGMPLAGTLVAISERGLDEKGNILGFLLGGPSPGSFAIKRSRDFDITDAAITPNGDLLILERKFSVLSGPGMRIRRVPLAALAPGALVEGAILVEADIGYEIDNMEGLSVHRAPDGALVLSLISDDNFLAIQRTLLLQFELTDLQSGR